MLKSKVHENEIHEVAKKMRLNSYETFAQEMKRKMEEEEEEEESADSLIWI